MVEDWGVERDRQRNARRRRRTVIGLVGLLLASLLVPFAMGIVDGFRGTHDGAQADLLKPYIGSAIALAMALLVPVLAWRGLREADEVERSQAQLALAGAGATALLLLPVLTAARDVLGIESPALVTWGAALGTAIDLYVLQRRRR